ncbi:MAG TPA: ATP-binding cassette domain-containing protein [Candidatus Dependentiae bacterium]|nr:ATP-binding cassette domain-containing protein [Candidatus Dependentiae bacterium]HRQ62997.1 ATP-binding cassette domain-containing protein [Candidatus Dependentiae bacterium]
METVIKIENLRKKLGDRYITDGVNLDIPAGQMTVIIGRSGEGKSILLKQVIGLIRPTSGKVIVEGTDITQLSEVELNRVFKKVGYVFQFAALLDSLNIFENIGITLLESGMPEYNVLPIVKEKLRLVHLKEENLYKYPSELSGGMRKRAGLARTLVTNPSIILYDEPTTGLDPITTRVIHELMYDMQQRLKLTSVVISHDIEIFKYADNVALLYEGKIKYFGDAKTIWESDNPYIYQFIRGLSEGPMQTDFNHFKDRY